MDVPPPPPDDSDVPPPPPDDSLTDDSDLPPPPPDDVDADGWPPPPPHDGYADYGDGAYDDGQWPPSDADGLGPGLQYDTYAETMGDMLPPPPQDEDEFDDGLGNGQVAEAGLAEVVDLQLTADESSGFGLGLDPVLVVDKVSGPARRDGWQLGWTVLAVQGQPVSNHRQLIQQLSRAGKTARFTVLIPRPAAGEAAELAQEEAAAATLLQSRFRGNQARLEYKQQHAAQAIQSHYRGHRSRTQLRAAREKEAARARAWESYRRASPKTCVSSSVKLPNSTSEKLLAERAAVATKMQATFRGKQTRKNLKLGKPPPGLERQLRLSREREYLNTHAPMHQSYLQQLQAAAKQLATELQQSGIDAATVLQQPIPDRLLVPTVSLAQAESGASKLRTQRTTFQDKSPRTLERAIGQDDLVQARYWREAWDSHYNCPYFWHKKTKEVRWEMPEGFSRSRSQSGGASARRSEKREGPVRSASSYRSAGSAVQSSRSSTSRTRRLGDSSRGDRTSRRPGTTILFLPS